MSNSKILPFDCNVVYSIDCRVSCRLGIIQASPYGQAWLATHLDILMSNNLDLNFGNGIYVAQMNYYDDILDTHEVNLWSSTPDKIIDILIDQINRNNYILIDLYWHDQFPEEAVETRTHSCTVIGYDIDKRVLHTVSLVSNKYIMRDIPFDLFIKLYEDAIKQYLYDPDFKTLRQMFYFTITSISAKKDISIDNYVFNAIVNKLGHEEGGACIEVTRHNTDKSLDNATKFYTGTSCILGIVEYIRSILESENISDYHGKMPYIVRTLCGLSEHRKIILLTMDWIIKALNCEEATIIEQFDTYKAVPKEMESITMLVQKYYVTKDIDILNRVVTKLESQFEHEKKILKSFVDNSFTYYKKYNGYEEYVRRLIDAG